MCLKGGYKTQTVTQLSNVTWALAQGMISGAGARVYFACLLSVSAREAAARIKARKRVGDDVAPLFLQNELSRLTGLSKRVVSRELSRLGKNKLLTFSESAIEFLETEIPESEETCEELAGRRSKLRPVPVPRSALRFLARCDTKSVILTMLGYLVRGMTIARRGGEVTGKGSVKASWIADVCGLCERSVRAARAMLIGLGWLSADNDSTQIKLNRTGAYFTINLEWEVPRKENIVMPEISGSAGSKNESQCAPESRNDISDAPVFAPPQAQKCTDFAPPYKDKKTSSKEESKNQKASGFAQMPTGVFKENRKGREGISLFDVKREDLFSFGKVEKLYFDACTLGLVIPCESSALNVLSAAIRARSAKAGDPARIFAGIIRRGLWAHITQAEEDQARMALVKYREENSERFRYEEMREAA